MKIILDTNIIFSALLHKQNKFKDIILNNEDLNFYTCNFLILEIFKYKEKIVKSSKAKDDVLTILNLLLHNINFLNEEFVSLDSKKKAFNLCREIDEKDTPFVALAIELDALLWTRDKKLIIGLLNKGFDRFFYP